ncbi:MAG TPA: DUF433 domain-containing protein [Ktedonobacterales bacterium]
MTEGNYPYVEERSGVLYVRGSRVPLESLVWLWREGHDAEAIQDAYTTLTLAEVYGAIAYYLDHRLEVDKEFAASEATYNAQRAAAEANDPARYARLREQFNSARARRTTLQSSPS